MSKKIIQRTTTGVLALAVTVGASVAPAHAAPNNSDAPENVIVMIGDGMGYNHVASTNLYETGQSRFITTGEPGDVTEQDGESVQVYEDFNLVGMATDSQSTIDAGYQYDPAGAWNDFSWAKNAATDSAAAGSAMATGTKIYNGALNIDVDGNELQTISEVAHETGRAAGVVSSVQYSHATPASYAVANESRNNYLEIGDDMVNAEYLDVIMGAGHPMYDNDGNERAASYDYISESTFNAVSNGDTDWDYVETKSDFEALAEGSLESDKVFGLAQVETTLQQGRSGGEAGQLPGEVAFNDNVPDLATMSEGALNVLGQDNEGFHLMIEGGAIDWTGHANDTTRNIEETQDFNAAVESVVDWVEGNSSWDETLLIVTADHETGYLGGAEDDPNFTEMTGSAGELPTVGWSSGDHTNHLVPYFFKGAGSDAILKSTIGTDPVRGDYIDNVTVANLLKDELWAEDTNDEDNRGNGPAKPAVPANPNGPGEPATPATPAEGNGQGKGNPGNSNGKGNSNLPSVANENAHQNANKNAGN
jgi:alkaline phosphatase